MRSARPGRLLAGFSDDNDLRLVAKIGSKDDAGLIREAEVLRALSGVRDPFLVPNLRWAGEWRDHYVVATDAVDAPLRDAGLSLDAATEICIALARRIPIGPVVHGDLTPWNFVRSGRSELALLDWEEGRFEDDPLYDLSHFIVQQGVLLGRFDPAATAKHLTEPGGSGWRYLEAIGADPREAREHVAGYLRKTEWFSGDAGHRYRVALGRVLYPASS
jgi:phosphotransferase family enzyme